MQSKILFTHDTARVELFKNEENNNSSIVVIFSPSLNRTLDGNLFGGKLLYENGFDVVSVKVIDDDWFQKIPTTALVAIANVLNLPQYKSKAGYGSSMGGYGAIAFSKTFSLDSVLAFSPQFSISESFDTRWSSHATRVQWNHTINPNSVSRSCNYWFVYDDHDLDRQHVEKIQELLPLDKVRHIRLPFTGHPAIHFLNDVGILKNLTISVLQAGESPKIDRRLLRRNSRSYYKNISARLIKTGKPKMALAVLGSSLQTFPAEPRLLKLKATAEERLGMLHESIHSLDLAFRSDTANPHLPYHKGNVLRKLRRYEDAVSAFDEAIKIDPSVSGFHRNRSAALLSMGNVDSALGAARNAYVLQPSDVDIRRHFVDLLVRTNDVEEALVVSRDASEGSLSRESWLHHLHTVIECSKRVRNPKTQPRPSEEIRQSAIIDDKKMIETEMSQHFLRLTKSENGQELLRDHAFLKFTVEILLDSGFVHPACTFLQHATQCATD